MDQLPHQPAIGEAVVAVGRAGLVGGNPVRERLDRQSLLLESERAAREGTAPEFEATGRNHGSGYMVSSAIAGT